MPFRLPSLSITDTAPKPDSVIITIASTNESDNLTNALLARITSLTRNVISLVCSKNWLVPIAVRAFSFNIFITLQGAVQT